MNSSRQTRQRSRDPLDRRVDQWLETGRQFVDGVAGNRPGQRKLGRNERGSGSSVQSVGRWVGEKLDWLLEDEDDWLEPWQKESQGMQSDLKPITSGNKRPLEALSRRITRSNVSTSSQIESNLNTEKWPDESTFRVDRWKRPLSQENQRMDPLGKTRSKGVNSRPLPRSTRRRS